MRKALASHWPEYLMECAEIGCFMISASLFAILLYHPASPIVRSIPAEIIRRTFMGFAMGLTAVAIIYSPWGKQSGAHINPAVTLTFFRLGKIAPWDAFFYIIAQFIGGIAGVALVAFFAEKLLAHPAVNYVATLPGPRGVWPAFAGEAAISFLLIFIVLAMSQRPKPGRWTGIIAGGCVALFIILESPISGMSMNPARSLGSAVLPHLWSSLWIYFAAPILAMLLAAELFSFFPLRVFCAKYHHQNNYRCIFCEYQALRTRVDSLSALTDTLQRKSPKPTIIPASLAVRGMASQRRASSKRGQGDFNTP
jgi:aquaporin Z